MVQDIRLTRRTAVAGLATGVAVFAAGPHGPAVAVPTGKGGASGQGGTDGEARFLSEAELATLRAVVDRVVPADTAPGAVSAGCAEAIDALLGAFTVSPPRIYAGGPFSDRAGSKTNHFAEFLPLDRYERLAWRLRIEGSRGRRRLERNGPVPGYQQVYREGLAALARTKVGEPRFADLPGPARDLALQSSSDPRVAALLDLAVVHTLQLMYGAPEYGGNRDIVGWTQTGFEGDVQPRGWTDEEVTDPESTGPLDVVTDLLGLGVLPLAAMASTEQVHGTLARSQDSYSGLRSEVRRLTGASDDVAAQLDRMRRTTAELIAQARKANR